MREPVKRGQLVRIGQSGKEPTPTDERRAEDVQPPLDAGLLAAAPADLLRQASERGRRARLADWFLGRRPDPVPAFIGPVDPPPETDDRVGICCSGGGIRSAAFNLGALQELQAHRRLQDADYLAAVSGGSYIAAAFAMVRRTWDPARGSNRPAKGEPGHDDSDPTLVNAHAPPFHRGSPEEQFLRNRSSYLAPNGLAKLFLVYRMILGLAWNLLLIEGLLFIAGVTTALALYRDGYPGLVPPRGSAETELVASPPGWAYAAVGALLAACLAIGLARLFMRFGDDRVRLGVETWAMRTLLASVGAAFVLLLAPELIVLMRDFDVGDDALGLVSPASVAAYASFATVIAGIAAQLRPRRTEDEEAEGGRARRAAGRAGHRVRLTLLYAAASVAVPLLALLGFLLPASWAVTAADPNDVLVPVVLVACGLVLVYLIGDLTTWSLHPFYKRRLATVFALKRVRGQTVQGRQIGQAVARDYGRLPSIAEADVSADDDPFPTLVVCAAANVSDLGATPPGRRVTSFTFSPGAVGGPLVGAVLTTDYEELIGIQARRDLDVLSTVAVSGAAVSPSMGKETRPALRALMALANVRLGVWMRNPRHVRRGSSLRRPRAIYLLFELFGRSGVNGKYLYVTDGGHYENLGLVELVRRGCTTIYCLDASGGTSFGALGDAIALARSELGVEIDVAVGKLVPDADGVAEREYTIGTITYPPPTETEEQRAERERTGRPPPTPVQGSLVYIRTVLTDDAPHDVQAFHEMDPRFPNHSTIDQFYTDQKFEAYRTLGQRAVHQACRALSRRRAEEAASPAVTTRGRAIATMR